MAGRLLLALCQADESRVNVGICSLKLPHRGNTDQLRRQHQDLLIANQHLHSLSDSHITHAVGVGTVIYVCIILYCLCTTRKDIY